MKIEVGGQPTPCGNFCSTTDVAFAPDGHVFIADGYRNARILEYTPDGKKVSEWGTAGTGPGQFRLPHSIQVGPRQHRLRGGPGERPHPALRSHRQVSWASGRSTARRSA